MFLVSVFENSQFKEEHWMIESSISKSKIDRYFRHGLCAWTELGIHSIKL